MDGRVKFPYIVGLFVLPMKNPTIRHEAWMDLYSYIGDFRNKYA